MSENLKRNISRLLFITIILTCIYFLYNTKVKSRLEIEKEVNQFENKLNIEEKEDSSTINLSELDLNMVGVLYVPKINLTIPVYDSTKEAALTKGVGIIEGTGNLQTEIRQNTVLTSHNGDNVRDLFINLGKMKNEDEFYTKDKKGIIRKYIVDNIQVVEPVDEGKHWIIDDKPRLTLRTCTPTGINSHRLLVSGVEVEYNNNVIPKGKMTFSSFEMGLIALGTLSLVLLIFTFRKDKENSEYETNFDWNNY